jgi:uroporphyrinogen-III synthase
MAGSERQLAGKRIVITRAPEQSAEFARLLEERGAEVLFLPAVEFAETEGSALLAALKRLGEFDWVFFTSQNAVAFFIRGALQAGAVLDLAEGRRPAIAAVGPATASTLERAGVRVSYLAQKHSGTALADELATRVKGKRVLLPRSDRAGVELPARLRSFGSEVTEVIVYRTLRPQASAETERDVRNAAVDVVTFASPSAFRNFASEFDGDTLLGLGRKVVFAAIGPVTAAAIRDAGFAVAIEAEDSTVTGLVDAIVGYFAKETSTGVQVR